MSRHFTAVVYRDPESGDYIGRIPALPGALTCASSMPELRDNLREVALLVLEDMAASGEKEAPLAL